MNDSDTRPNVVLYISHDSGRFIGPYGHTTVDTRFLDRFAEQSLLFEQAFSTCPLCSPSRASIVTSCYPHEVGVNGLTTYRTGNFDMTRPDLHLASLLGSAGYESVVCGPVHEAQEIRNIGFAHALGGTGSGQNHGGDMRNFADEIQSWLGYRDASSPYYLQIGSHETHRDWSKPDVDPYDANGISLPPGVLRTPESEAQMALLQGAVRRMDQELARIVSVVEQDAEATGRPTVIVLTTDHGVDMPDNKGTLTDRGLGVFLLVRLANHASQRVNSPVSQLDVAPTIMDVCGIDLPSEARGRSLLRFVQDVSGATPGREPDRRTADAGDQELSSAYGLSDAAFFAEKTYHDGYDPTRSIRTPEYRYIRYFSVSVLRDIRLDSYRQSSLFSHDLYRTQNEELFVLADDPDEFENRLDDPKLATVRDSLKRRLAEWMIATDDPLLSGPVDSPLAQEAREEYASLVRIGTDNEA